MPITLKQLLSVVEKIKNDVKPEDLDKPVKLNIGNAKWIADIQSGEWGVSPNITVFDLSVGGENPSLMIFGG